MKQRQFLLTLLMALMPLLTSARTVWTGSQVINWSANPSTYLSIDAATLGTITAGDCIVLTYEVTVEDSNYPQIQLNDVRSTWTSMAHFNLSSGMTETRIYTTPAMATALASGTAISGYGCTLTKVDVVDGDGSDYTNSVWIGETAIAKDWSNWQSIDKSVFESAVENYYIRFKFKDLLSGAQFGLQYNNGSSWVAMPGVSNVAISGLSVQKCLLP